MEKIRLSNNINCIGLKLFYYEGGLIRVCYIMEFPRCRNGQILISCIICFMLK